MVKAQTFPVGRENPFKKLPSEEEVKIENVLPVPDAHCIGRF
jgi:hypothetical protein